MENKIALRSPKKGADIDVWRGEMEIVFKRGSLNKDGSVEPSRLNRVYSTLFVPEDYSMLVAKEGFLFSAQFHEKWGIVDSGFTSSLYISKDTGVSYTVRREREDDGETADIALFSSSVSVVPFSDTVLYKRKTFRGAKETGSILDKASISFIGDSYIANNHNAVEKSWNYKLAEKHDMDWNCFGINGNGLVSKEAHGTPVVDRLSVVPDSDYIIVIGGKNDYNHQLSPSVFEEGVDRIISRLKDSHRNSKIAFFTPWDIVGDGMDEKEYPLSLYSEIILSVSSRNGIKAFNTKNSGINMYDPDFRASFSQGPNDKSHLNESGHQLFLPLAEKFLESLD